MAPCCSANRKMCLCQTVVGKEENGGSKRGPSQAFFVFTFSCCCSSQISHIQYNATVLFSFRSLICLVSILETKIFMFWITQKNPNNCFDQVLGVKIRPTFAYLLFLFQKEHTCHFGDTSCKQEYKLLWITQRWWSSHKKAHTMWTPFIISNWLVFFSCFFR